MGTTPKIRITNRGTFPRWRLESVGSSSKRDKMDDTSQGGWFGSGTKIAPIAALALGMEVHVSSHDEHGDYQVTYGICQGPGGKEDPRILLTYTGAKSYQVVTPFSPEGFINWSKPIGDDQMKEFRVWREYFRNGRDADPTAPHVHGVESVRPALVGETWVHLTRTAEFEHIWKHLDRYFKYLSQARPVLEIPGIGRIWPKSEAKMTRMFSLGTMALCNKSTTWSTLHDYDFDEKTLMSEERTFENMGKVYGELSRILASCPEVALARELLEAMMDGRAELERIALAQLNAKSPIPCKEVWCEAWRSLQGEDAVIASGNWADEHARYSFKKKPIRLESATLKGFLKLCGIPSANDIIPSGEKLGIKVIPASGLDLAERMILDEARRLLAVRYPEVLAVPVHVYEPLTEEVDAAMNGFCQPNDPPFTEVYLKRSLLRAEAEESDMDADLRRTLRTLNHEYRHVRTGARDGTMELMKQADADHADLLIELRALEEAEREAWERGWDDEDTDPGRE